MFPFDDVIVINSVARNYHEMGTVAEHWLLWFSEHQTFNAQDTLRIGIKNCRVTPSNTRIYKLSCGYCVSVVLLDARRQGVFLKVWPSRFRHKKSGNGSEWYSWWGHPMETIPRYWPFGRGVHRSSENSPHKGKWRGALMFSLICAWTNGWANIRDAGDLRRRRTNYGTTVMIDLVWLFRPQCHNGSNSQAIIIFLEFLHDAHLISWFYVLHFINVIGHNRQWYGASHEFFKVFIPCSHAIVLRMCNKIATTKS